MGNQEETPNNLLENNNDSKETQTELNNTNDNEVQNVGEGKEQRPVITLPKTEEKPNTVTIDGVEYSKDVVEKAKLQGWKEKDELGENNSKIKYLPPDQFVKKGEEYAPFVQKKMKKLEEENEKMSRLLQKKLLEDSKDRLQSVKNQIKSAKDNLELDGYDDLVERKMQIEKEIESYNDNFSDKNATVPQIPHEIEEWNGKNIWSIHTFSDGTKNPYYDSARTVEANNIFKEIQSHNPTWSLDRILATVDYNLQRKSEVSRQKANLTPPVTNNSQAVTPPTNQRSFDNLKPNMKRIFEKCNNDGSGHAFTGESLKKMRQTFIENCADSDFNF